MTSALSGRRSSEPLTASLQKRYVPLPPAHVFAYRYAFQVLAKLLTEASAAKNEPTQALNHATSVTEAQA